MVMDINQAAKNLRGAVDPTAEMTPVERLMLQLRQNQIGNVQSQQQGINQTQARIKALQGQGGGQEGIGAAKWGALADMFAPQGQKTNFAQVGAALQPEQKDPAKEIYALQQQLIKQQQNLGSASTDLLGELTPEDKESYDDWYKKLKAEEALDLANKKAFEKYKSTLEPADPEDNWKEKMTEEYRLKGELARTRAKGKTPARTEYQKIFDKANANAMATFIHDELPKWRTNIQTLDDLHLRLENASKEGAKENLTGMSKSSIPLVPDMRMGDIPMRSIFNSSSVDAEEEARTVLQQSLKAVLGGAFSRAEGEQLVKNGYNVNLDEKINAKRIKRMSDQMKYAISVKTKMYRHAQVHGNLDTFKMPKVEIFDGKTGKSKDISKFLAEDVMSPSLDGVDISGQQPQEQQPETPESTGFDENAFREQYGLPGG